MEVGKSQNVYSFLPHLQKNEPNHCPSTFFHCVKKLADNDFIHFIEDGAKMKVPSEIPTFNSDKHEKEYPSNNSFNHVGGDDCDCSIYNLESEEDESDKEDSEDHESEDGGTDEYLSDDDEPEMDEYWASAESRLLYDY